MRVGGVRMCVCSVCVCSVCVCSVLGGGGVCLDESADLGRRELYSGGRESKDLAVTHCRACFHTKHSPPLAP